MKKDYGKHIRFICKNKPYRYDYWKMLRFEGLDAFLCLIFWNNFYNLSRFINNIRDF